MTAGGPAESNVHGTAIVVGTTGLIFLGPSGAGKSALAFDCMAEARLAGDFAALISDDQVFVSRRGVHVLASRPEPIKGLIELRHAGIVKVESLPHALLHYAILVVEDDVRLPPERETATLTAEITLPALRVPTGARMPFTFIKALIAAEVAARPT
ncbi:MAG: serine kinase [Shinella sp.]|nr:MAG: serine kinase [Shinella sp.]